MNRPVVLVVARRTTRKSRLIDYVGELHLELLIRLRTLPLVIPVVDGTPACLPQYMQRMKSLLLVEGEDIEPKRFRAAKGNFTHLEKTHPLKDEIEIRLLRHALRRKLPVLGICRGSQLLNVVCGGTLYGDVREEIQADPGKENTPPPLVRKKDPAGEQLPSSGRARFGRAFQTHGLRR
jgi:gamma-glutamyl-gamma-aminobutyrate hydrolase PuuD